MRLLSNSRKTATVTVRGIYKDDTLLQNGMITATLLRHLTDVSGVQTVLATAKSGSDPEEVAKRAEDRLAAQFPTAKLQSNAEFKKSIGDQVNTLLSLIYASARGERADLACSASSTPCSCRCTSARARSGCCVRSASRVASCAARSASRARSQP